MSWDPSNGPEIVDGFLWDSARGTERKLRYRLNSVLGSGAFGTVFRYVDQAFVSLGLI